jgi:hypothetical protein
MHTKMKVSYEYISHIPLRTSVLDQHSNNKRQFYRVMHTEMKVSYEYIYATFLYLTSSVINALNDILSSHRFHFTFSAIFQRWKVSTNVFTLGYQF